MSRPTWEMDKIELAKAWAEHHGYIGRDGGWIYRTSDGAPIAHGWLGLADLLVELKLIVVGVGIDWTLSRTTKVKTNLQRTRALASELRRQAWLSNGIARAKGAHRANS